MVYFDLIWITLLSTYATIQRFELKYEYSMIMSPVDSIPMLGQLLLPSLNRICKFNESEFCQFSFRWIYDYGSNKSTWLETAKSHLCALIIANPNPVWLTGKSLFSLQGTPGPHLMLFLGLGKIRIKWISH